MGNTRCAVVVGIALGLVLVGLPTVPAVASSSAGLLPSVLPPRSGVTRVVCDDVDTGRAIGACERASASRVEGGATSGRAEVDVAYLQLGRVADFYARFVSGGDVGRLIGVDTGDGLGRALRVTVRACSDWRACPMRNAFWSEGEGAMFLGTGFAGVFDVIAHELTHGVTAATSGLVYSGQSGAISESLSDVMAELAEQIELGRTDWLLGEDLRISGVPTPIRDLADPTRALAGRGSGQPDRMGSALYQRDSTCDYTNDSCHVHANSGVGNKTGYLITHGATFNGQTVVGIGATKAAALYWKVEGALPTKATYADLGRALAASCQRLLGTAGSGFTSGDCDNVKRATWATELLPKPANVPAALTVAWPTKVGTSLVVTGSLAGRSAGTKINLRRHALLRWVTVATAVTDAAGRFRIIWAPKAGPRAGTFRVESAAGGKGAPAVVGVSHVLK